MLASVGDFDCKLQRLTEVLPITPCPRYGKNIGWFIESKESKENRTTGPWEEWQPERLQGSLAKTSMYSLFRMITGMIWLQGPLFHSSVTQLKIQIPGRDRESGWSNQRGRLPNPSRAQGQWWILTRIQNDSTVI